MNARCVAMDDDAIFHKEKLNFTFMLWDCAVHNVTIGYCEAETDSVIVLINYTDSSRCTKVLKGEAWTSDSTYPSRDQFKADLPCVGNFFQEMKDLDALHVFVVFDGQLAVDRDFDLHLHFNHPIKKRSLLVKNVAKGNNPLLVIDSFS